VGDKTEENARLGSHKQDGAEEKATQGFENRGSNQLTTLLQKRDGLYAKVQSEKKPAIESSGRSWAGTNKKANRHFRKRSKKGSHKSGSKQQGGLVAKRSQKHEGKDKKEDLTKSHEGFTNSQCRPTWGYANGGGWLDLQQEQNFDLETGQYKNNSLHAWNKKKRSNRLLTVKLGFQ